MVRFTTYKHIWIVDSKSGLTRVINRRSYPLSLIGRLFKKLRILTKDREILTNPALMYDSNAPFGQKFAEDAESDIQKSRADSFVQLMFSHGWDFEGKSVLDLSGGNGSFVDRLQHWGAKKVVHTEFSLKAVDYARSFLGLESHHLDLNKQSLAAELGGGQKFDIVLLRGLIEFWDDLEQIAQDIRKITKPGALVVVSHQIVTLGAALRTQFDQYNMSNLRTAGAVTSTFEKHGFRSEITTEQIPYDRDFAFARMLGPFAPFYIFYLARALVSYRKIKVIQGLHSLECKIQLQIFIRV